MHKVLTRIQQKNLNNVVVQELDRVGLFRVISMSEISQMIQYDQLKTAMGCDDESCLAEIGGALGVDMLVSGTIGKIGSTYVLSLKLVDVKSVKILNREERTLSGPAEVLIEHARIATRRLIQPLLDQASGRLLITCNEEGADLRIDDVLVATTPVKELTVPGGYHKISLTKKGFIVFSRDVKIKKDVQFRLPVRLQPSQDYIENYRRQAQMWRVSAWSTTGLGLVALLAGGGLLGLSVVESQALTKDIQDYNAQSERSDADWSALHQRESHIGTFEGSALASGIVSLIALTTSPVLFLLAPDIDRYSATEQNESGANK